MLTSVEKEKLAIKRWKERNPDRVRAANDRYKSRHPELVRERSKNWNRKHRKENPFYHVKRLYGIEPFVVEQMKKDQNECCAICGKKSKLCIDHDHNTGRIRGLLCNKCNSILGFADDSVAVLLQATKYLGGVCVPCG